jgi:cell division protein FtsN
MGMRGRRGGTRTGTFLVLSGIAGVLTVTFIAGVWTGRNWPVIVGNPRSSSAAEAPAAPRGRVVAERPRPAEPLPALTFYHDLKAPLTAPPPSPRPGKPARPPELKRLEPGQAEAASPEAGPRFTVQVAAYNAKPPAEALRTTLAAAGHDARVVETEQSGGVRYRVQVGVFATRDAARDAAVRLAAERSLSTFVTTR